MSDEGQGGTREAAAMLDEVSAHHRDERDADEISGACGQSTNQMVDRTSGKVHWRGSRMESWVGRFSHPPSISKFDCFLLLNW
jgi:hypothetical protein